MWSWLSGLVFVAVLATAARSETVTVAAAANFRKPLDEIAAHFTTATGHEVVVSAGSSGQLYAQIANGAPFDVFLSADQARPAAAIAAGLAVPGSQRTYAVGRLILIFRDEKAAARIGTPPDLSKVQTLSVANPATAPYGAAAVQVIEKLGGTDALAGRIAEAQNVSGVNAAVQTGAAEAGFAALASLSGPGAPEPRGWRVPAELHDPIRQDAVLLERGRENPAAIAFHDYLFGEEAAGLIRAYGYDVP